MKPKIRCKNCHRQVPANPRLKHQQYCNRKSCQRARKTKWEQHKIATDQDYQTNRKESQQGWRENNPGYWSKYRRNHPHYCKRNRQMQKIRDTKRRARHLAKMDTLRRVNRMISGGYYLIPILDDLAKMDALMQKIYIISDSYNDLAKSCKEGLVGLPANAEIYCHQNSKEALYDDNRTLPGPGS